MDAKIKAIFSDIDGTLLNTSHQISDKTRQKLREITGRGIPFVLVSARMPQGMRGIRDQIGPANPMICYSGALIVDASGQIMYSKTHQAADVRKMWRITQETCGQIQMSFNIYAGDQWLVTDAKNKWVLQEQEITGIVPSVSNFYEEIEDFREKINDQEKVNDFRKESIWTGVHKVLCMGEPDEIACLEAILVSALPHINIYKSKPTYLEIMPEGVSKSKAMQILEEHLEITREETIAFGDGYNDMDMLSYAGIGVAMGNAPEPVKASADMITEDNDHDGILSVLEDIWN